MQNVQIPSKSFTPLSIPLMCLSRPPSDFSLLISTHRNCFYGDCAVSWSFGAKNIGLVLLILLGWVSLHYVYKASRSCLLCHPYIPHCNLIYLSPLIFNIAAMLRAPTKYYIACAYTCISRELHVYTGGLLANTVHCILT